MSQVQEKMSLEDWLDDLCVRFIINLPQEDLQSVARICFQVEEAHWFYEDFIRPLDPTLPNMSLRTFCLRMFQHCPLFASFSEDSYMQAFDEFVLYKTRVPVRGAIMMNHAMDSTVLVRGWKSNANWSFPRGKINKDEDDLDCAIREVFEETGFDVRGAGLVPEDNNVKYIEITMRDQHMRLYVFRDVPMDTVFEPKTRKEIGKIQWYKLQDLPAFRKKKGVGRGEGNAAEAATNANKFYMVAPFLVPLKKWVVQQKKRDAHKAARQTGQQHPVTIQEEDLLTEDDQHEIDEISPPIPTSVYQPGLGSNGTDASNAYMPSGVSAATNVNAGAALMSILQSKAPSTGQNGHTSASPSAHPYPHTPHEQVFTEATRPRTPPHNHPTQRLSYPQGQPPYFGVGQQQFQQQQQPNRAYQHQAARPQVHISTDYNGQPEILVSPRHKSNQQPPQLMHPQPQPPQVQQSLLIRGMVPTPAMHEQMAATGPPQGYRANAAQQQQQHLQQQQQHLQQQQQQQQQHLQQRQYQQQQQQQQHLQQRQQQQEHHLHQQQSQQYQQYQHQSPLGAQGTPPQPRQSLEPTAHSMSLLGVFKGTTPQPDVKQHAAPPQNTPQSQGYPQNINIGPASPQFPSSNSSHPVGSFNKHQSSLLDMFKQTDTTKKLVGGETMPQGRSPLGLGAAAAAAAAAVPALEKSVSPATAVRQSLEHHGQSQVSNPELNLPFGALAIASRKKPVPSFQQSPQPQQSTPTRSMAYPYGTSFDSSASNLAMSLGAPSAATLPVPSGIFKARPEATVEQKSSLLSLFGKGKEPASMGENMRPRSRVASIASGAGDNASLGSRRGSQTPLTPADRDFLMGFLKDASRNHAKR
ncbi:hypothetical protein PG994_003643 [Apiospora phragmitis]|uniref:Nudix hydrolase domain-containing protein n=1 Tax=Apiospora phragmitis TaxID=2905665 RepID=A0ABR1W1C4_9PEZI